LQKKSKAASSVRRAAASRPARGKASRSRKTTPTRRNAEKLLLASLEKSEKKWQDAGITAPLLEISYY
jgi:hypothetical protein